MQTSWRTTLAATLAAHHGGGEVVAIRYGDQAEVEVIETTERMPVDDFVRRYPNSVVLQ